ncbi:hypothetical protein CspeluHIS016_0103470 [Cutaneotrichosporon spelunceum]|uniref:Proteasome maturation factor UMP1 n=1 Tax=Cutaneotrichosporon spelunceum TaxID=1672016 RepID=A0AAD3TNV3_9TREE|nr:hypothetical protein CspeluHIS016_0103470 [Cutaneotrichosporon spelunceum]
MSLRVVPPTVNNAREEYTVSTKATNHPLTGTHDAFRYGPTSAAQTVAAGNASPLQARLQKAQLRQTIQRQTFGVAVPLRQAMEVKIAKEELHHPAMLSATPSGLPLGGTHNLSLEILQGKDEGLDETDFMSGGADLREILDVSAVMERSRGI